MKKLPVDALEKLSRLELTFLDLDKNNDLDIPAHILKGEGGWPASPTLILLDYRNRHKLQHAGYWKWLKTIGNNILASTIFTMVWEPVKRKIGW